MPDRKEPDWERLVRGYLKDSSRTCGQDVIAELAAHLEEVYEHARARGSNECGSNEKEAMQRTLQEVDDWDVLAGQIACAKSEEDGMTYRTKNLSLPTLASLTLNAVLLVVFDRIHARPLIVGLGHLAMMLQLAWVAALVVVGQTKPEEAFMNQRTRSIWLPGFVSLTAASLFLFVEEVILTHDPSSYFTDLSLQPLHLISRMPLWFYSIWLAAQILCGALGAFLSRRGGGTATARILAGAFPAIVMFGLCAVVIPVSALFEHNSYVFSHPSGLALAILIWAGAPAVALLIGAAPFLKESSLQHA